MRVENGLLENEEEKGILDLEASTDARRENLVGVGGGDSAVKVRRMGFIK